MTDEIKPVFGPVPAWSYSTLSTFEECPYRVYLRKVKGLKEPSNKYAERGTKIHTQAEDYVQGVVLDLPKSLEKFEEKFDVLRDLHMEGKVEVEQDWAFTYTWQQTGWTADDCWARIKLDAMVHEDEKSGRAIDYKTGKKFGNEVKHGQQLLTYALAAFKKYPELEFVQTELWYLDRGEETVQRYTRKQVALFEDSITRRANALTQCHVFDPKPSKKSCKWCHFAESGACEWAYQE